MAREEVQGKEPSFTQTFRWRGFNWPPVDGRNVRLAGRALNLCIHQLRGHASVLDHRRRHAGPMLVDLASYTISLPSYLGNLLRSLNGQHDEGQRSLSLTM